MPRYFLELAYKGTAYSGFQTQDNAVTIQSEVEKAFRILHRRDCRLTGSSRTDAGVHALQNFFHFDDELPLHPQLLYKMNAILPPDIVLRGLQEVAPDAHSRFDARSREYAYQVYTRKDPFLDDRAYFFPYRVEQDRLNAAAALLFGYEDFTSFSKRNTQVKTFRCRIITSRWEYSEHGMVYHVQADRFLRGMVRALTATMLKVGRGTLSTAQFAAIIEAKDCTRASFAVPAHGLSLVKVHF